MIIISDVHGNYKTLKKLLDKIPQSEKDKGVVFSGDLIDRGPGSKDVVQLVIDNGYKCTMGNHESMMLEEYKTILYNMANGKPWRLDDPWYVNGGKDTLNSYIEHVDGETMFALDIFEDHIEFIKTLPIYLEFPDIKNDDGRYLVVSHSNIFPCWKDIKNGNKYMSERILWGRPLTIRDVPEIYNVIGHTPYKNGPKIRKIYANIDTGCYYKEYGYGKLTALQFPEMKIYQQENID